MSYESYIDLFREYFKLKNSYDNKLKKKKRAFNKLDISPQEKKSKLDTFNKQRPCINCKKKGGSIFTNNKGRLKVICGHKKPCNLHIELQKPKYYNLSENLEIKNKQIESIKQDITAFKLDLLFGLQDEEVVLNEFDTLKEQMHQALEEKKTYQKIFDNKNKIIEIKPNDSDDVKDVLIDDFLNDLQKRYNNLVSDFKKKMLQYKKSNQASLLEDILQKYKDEILPIRNKIRELKYQETYINEYKQDGGKKGIKLMPIYHLIPTKITLDNKSMWDSSFKIISNKK